MEDNWRGGILIGTKSSQREKEEIFQKFCTEAKRVAVVDDMDPEIWTSNRSYK